MKNGKTIQKINKIKSWFFDIINKINKPLAILNKKNKSLTLLKLGIKQRTSLHILQK